MRSVLEELCDAVRAFDQPARLRDAIRHALLLEHLAMLSDPRLRTVLLQFDEELVAQPIFDGEAFIDEVRGAMRDL